MARKVEIQCDICKKPCNRIVRKLFMSPARRTNPTRSPHSEYTHHLDVGDCCLEKLTKGFRWTKRLSASEYNDKRRNGKAA